MDIPRLHHGWIIMHIQNEIMNVNNSIMDTDDSRELNIHEIIELWISLIESWICINELLISATAEIHGYP